jgi:tetratricopeptide (TPR) repeat protein
MPQDRFRALPEERQKQLDRWTRAFLHHQLHYSYHASDEPEDLDRALAHLQASAALAPEFFFDLAHIYVWTTWGTSPRRALAESYDLRTIARAAMTFTRHQFRSHEALRELFLLLLDLEEYDQLNEFLEHHFTQGTITEYADLIALLGLLEYRQGNADAAIAHLTTLEDQYRYPLVLARALEATGSLQAASQEYQRILEIRYDDEDEDDFGWPSHLANRALQGVYYPIEFGDKVASLFVRRLALNRIVELTTQLEDRQRMRLAAKTYVTDFPWDADAQLVYAEGLRAELEQGVDLPSGDREELTRQLKRTVGLLATLDLEGTRRERIAQLNRLVEAD